MHLKTRGKRWTVCFYGHLEGVACPGGLVDSLVHCSAASRSNGASHGQIAQGDSEGPFIGSLHRRVTLRAMPIQVRRRKAHSGFVC